MVLLWQKSECNRSFLTSKSTTCPYYIHIFNANLRNFFLSCNRRIFQSYSDLQFHKIAQLYHLLNYLKFVILQISSPPQNRNKNTPDIQQKIKSKKIKLKETEGSTESKNQHHSGSDTALITASDSSPIQHFIIDKFYYNLLCYA